MCISVSFVTHLAKGLPSLAIAQISHPEPGLYRTREMSGGLTYLHDWQYNAVVGQYQRWSKSRNFWILKDPTTNKETSMNADMSEPEWPDDMTAILSIQNAPINM